MKMKKKSLLTALPILATVATAVAITTPIVLNQKSHTESVLLNSDSTISNSSMNFEDSISPELKQKILELEHQADSNSRVNTLEQVDTLTGHKPQGDVKEIKNTSITFEEGVSPELKAVIQKLERQTDSNSHEDTLEQIDTLTGYKPQGDVKEVSTTDSIKFADGVSQELKEKILKLEHQFEKRSNSNPLEQIDKLTGKKPSGDVKKINNEDSSFAFFSRF